MSGIRITVALHTSTSPADLPGWYTAAAVDLRRLPIHAFDFFCIGLDDRTVGHRKSEQ
jgi:hypothetical protein